MSRLEDGFVAHIVALVAHPHDQRVGALNLLLESVRVLSEGKSNPIFICWSSTQIISHPIGSYARTTVVLDEGDAILVDALAGVGQGDGGDITPGVLALDEGMLIILESRDVGREVARLVAIVRLLPQE